MTLRGLAATAGLGFALLLAACGGGSGRNGSDVVVSGAGPSTQILSGQTATFTMTVANAGNGSASNVTVRNSVAYPLVFDSITCAASGNTACPDLTSTSNMVVPDLPQGSSLTFTVSAHLATGGGSGALQVSDTMSASFSGDINATNNTVTVSSTAYYSTAAVVLTGVGPTSTVAGGSTAQFVMTVTNNGPDTATNLKIDDNVQGPLTLTGITCTATGAGICPSTLSFQNNVDALPANSSLVFTISAIASPPRGSSVQFANKMAVSLDNDPDTSDNTLVVQGTAYTAQSGVFVAGAGPTAPVPSGSQTSFTMTVGNAGPDEATDVPVTDSTDNSLTFTGVSCQAANGAVCPDTLGAVMTIPSIPAPASSGAPVPTLTFNVGVQVKAGYSGTFHNTMTVNPSSDSNRADNTANATGTAVSQDVNVSGVAPAGPVVGGSTAIFTMTVANAGPSTASNVTITDTITTGNATLGVITCSATGGAMCPATTSGTMTAPTIPVGGSLVFTVPAVVASSATGQVTNSMTATAPGESSPLNNTASVSVGSQSANLGVSETSASTAPAGGSAVFVAVVANPGPGVATNVSVNETLSPAGYAATVTCSASAGAFCPATLGQSLTIPTMKVGDVLTFIYTVPVASSQRGEITSTVTISSASDTDVSNNTAVAKTQAVNASSGSYTVFAADGNQYALNVDFDAGTYTMSSFTGGNVWTRNFTGPSGGDYTVSGPERFRVATDLIVGGHNFDTGAGVLPYVAARNFVTSLLQAQGGYDLATRNLPASGATTHAGTANISNNTLFVCQSDTSVKRANACDSNALTAYSLTLSGTVFSGTNTASSSDVYNFVIARSDSLTLLLSAGKAADGTPQLRIGAPDQPSIVTSTLRGASTLGTGDWGTVTLTPSSYVYDNSVSGASDSASLSAVFPAGGSMVVGTNQALQKIYVMQAVPVEVTVGDFSGGASGFLQVTIP